MGPSLFSRHEESWSVPTKLQFWAGYHLDRLNYAHQQRFNFLLFGLSLLAVGALLRRSCPGLPVWAVCAFLAFALSPRAHQAFAWAHDSTHHYAMLGFFGAVLCLFRDELAWPWAAAGAACALTSIVSHSLGLPAIAAVWLAFCAVHAGRGRGPSAPAAGAAAPTPGSGAPIRGVALAIGAALVVWLLFYPARPSRIPATAFWTMRYWRFFFNLVSWGFGSEQISLTLGMLCFCVAAYPLFRRLRDRPSPSEAAAPAALLGLLAALAGVALGRAAIGLDYSKASRYAAVAVWLVPLSAAAWHRALRGSSRLPSALAAVWLLAGLGHFWQWDFSVYRLEAEDRRAGLACVRAYYGGRGPDVCPTVYYAPLAEQLDRARRLGIAFTRTSAD
ncbi:MAG: hypothetical protein NTX64_16050 [Elusimicrobia bacterium]|nr:hypothetical protein [Elusimicrobiota bacterium]